MAKNIRLVAMVPVEFRQADMQNFWSFMPYGDQLGNFEKVYGEQSRRAERIGACYLTEKVVWGEVWIADRLARGTVWTGYIRDGQLFLDQSARESQVYSNRPTNGEMPSSLPQGSYKIWLDAWVRRGRFQDAYKGAPVFTKEVNNLEQSPEPWSAAAPPERKYWQDIEVPAPTGRGPSPVYIRSRRFHWVYRLSEFLDTLDQLLAPYESLMAHVADTRDMALHLYSFLYLMVNSGNNIAHIMGDLGNQQLFIRLRSLVYSVWDRCQSFIVTGAASSVSDDALLTVRRHLNNISQLVWHLIHDEQYQKDVLAFDPLFAEEHRMMMSRLGYVFNRIPKASDSDTEYGKRFAQEFAFPHFNVQSARAGAAPAFPDYGKKYGITDWLNATRKYGVSMINAATVFTNKIDATQMGAILEAQGTLHSEAVQAANRAASYFGVGSYLGEAKYFAAKFRAAGDAAQAAHWEGVKETLIKDMRDFDPQLDGELTDIQSKISSLEKQRTETKTALDRLKSGGTGAKSFVAFLEMFDIAVKALVVKTAYTEFVNSAGKPAEQGVLKGTDLTFRTADLVGTVLKSSGLGYILKPIGFSGDTIQVFGKFGKGLNAAADIASAAVYGYDIFITHTYGDDLLQQYAPNDAVTIYGWHLVVFGGKWIQAGGSTMNAFGAGAIGTRLQAVGYALQFVGEFGEAVAKIGKAEKKHFLDVEREMWNWANMSAGRMRDLGIKSWLYSDQQNEEMRQIVERFDWRPVGRTEFREMFGVATLGAPGALGTGAGG